MKKQKFGNILLVLFSAFMIFSVVSMLVAKPNPEFAPLNLSIQIVQMLGAIKVLFAILLWVPKFNRLAILVLTAYLGGAVMASLTMLETPVMAAATLFVLWAGSELKFGDLFNMCNCETCGPCETQDNAVCTDCNATKE
jgi:hypothetical protein